MTARKADLTLPVRTPAYVSRTVGAAELCVSPATWDAMVARGELPPPDHRIGGKEPRWKWEGVAAWLSGDPDEGNIPRDPYVVAAEGVNAKAQGKRRG